MRATVTWIEDSLTAQAAGHPGLAVIPPLNGGRARSHF